MNLQASYHLMISEQDDGKFIASLSVNDVGLWMGTARENEADAMLEATCFLTSQYQKPKDK